MQTDWLANEHERLSAACLGSQHAEQSKFGSQGCATGSCSAEGSDQRERTKYVLRCRKLLTRAPCRKLMVDSNYQKSEQVVVSPAGLVVAAGDVVRCGDGEGGRRPAAPPLFLP